MFFIGRAGWLLPGILAAGVGFVATHFNLWHWSGVFIMTDGYFEDLRQVTSTAGCIRTDPSWSLASASCDPWLRPYNYPTLWARAFAALGLDGSRTGLVGYALILLFAAAVSALAFFVVRGRPSRWRILVLSAGAVSPPALFAMERGNIDIVVFALVVSGVVLAATGFLALAAFLVAAAATLKLFPIGAAPLVLLGRRELRSPVVLAIVLGIGAVVVGPEFGAIAGGTPQTTWQSFGVAIVPLAVAHAAGASWAPLAVLARPVGWMVFVLVLAGLLLVRTRGPRRIRAIHSGLIRALLADQFAAAALVGGGGALVVAYLVGTSWDYRLVFALPVLAALLRIPRRAGGTAPLLAMLFLAQMFLTYPLSASSPAQLGAEPWIGTVWILTAPYLAILVAEVCVRGWLGQRTGSRQRPKLLSSRATSSSR